MTVACVFHPVFAMKDIPASVERAVGAAMLNTIGGSKAENPPKPTSERANEVIAKKRRDKIARMHADGLSVTEMHKHLDASRSLIWIDHKRLGLTPHKSRREPPPQTVERRKKTRILFDLGAKPSQAAEILGCTRQCVRNDYNTFKGETECQDR